MDRRRFLLTSLAGALAAPRSAGAQEAGKMRRIGHLHPARPKPSAAESGPFFAMANLAG